MGPYRQSAAQPHPEPPMPNPLGAIVCLFRGHTLDSPRVDKAECIDKSIGLVGRVTTMTRYCTRCGLRDRHEVVQGKCPVCKAAPDEPCDMGLHS